ncbi:transcriptional regulator, TraR/DksA family [Roseovarius mucosus DSM 17069]|uniref:Transcriptional regulator, TraR/DksA family n=1 Tax=Roseovarius mucosus DSM 17069 TaxID=1288298 RepID=A0A0A0HMJ7_9RHOB|nr:TraR/DksA C4-type zinc finger protein [Roseovarius mucosus]KGM89062.1 transcriptional regulator, TraR/DksA family [Roseovarius mucosus DSM 17069]MAN98765.1 dimethylmenaquinone methyltransferase [Roseovarius sp.]
MLETERYRLALMARLGELDKRLHAIEDELDSTKSKDWDDAAIEREGDEVLEHLGQYGQEEVARIRAALDRIRKGTFGTCARCEEQIAADRLDVLPETPLCRACAAQVS